MSVPTTRKLFTFEDCLRMVEAGVLSPAERIELIQGEILVMSPAGIRHSVAVTVVSEAIVLRAQRAVTVWTQNAVVLDPLVAPEPDIAVLKRRRDGDVSSYPGPSDVLLIVEVSDSSLEYDSTIKLELYAIAGIPEYWIADLRNDRLLVYSRPEGSAYSSVVELHRGDTLAPELLPDCRLAVEVFLP